LTELKAKDEEFEERGGMRHPFRHLSFIAILGAVLILHQGCAKNGAQDNKGSADSARQESEATALRQETRVAGVRVIEVQPGVLQLRLQATGVVRSKHQVPITAEVAGKVIERTRELGDCVVEGETILRLDPEPYELAAQQASAAFAAAQVAQDQARRDLERSKRLRESGNISQFELENAELGERNAAANLEMADAARKLADRNLRLTRVASPIRGTIVQLDVQIGQALQPGMQIGTVVALDQLEIEVGLSEREIAQVRRGNRVLIHSEAFPGETFAGAVKFIGAAGLDPGKTFPVVITLDNTAESGLKPGMAVSVEIIYADYAQILRIPRSALVQGAEQPSVYIVEGDVARSRRISLGPGDEQAVVVENGLLPGDRLVVEGQNILRDGTLVKIHSTQADSE
jgi:RND family efflux transporter MFP subunit